MNLSSNGSLLLFASVDGLTAHQVSGVGLWLTLVLWALVTFVVSPVMVVIVVFIITGYAQNQHSGVGAITVLLLSTVVWSSGIGDWTVIGWWW
jgi:hypothetical protein